MKKFIALLLVFVMSISFTLPCLAAENGNIADSVITDTEAEPEIDRELESIISTVKDIVTFIYDYATQPEEPAVDLEAVLMIVTAIVTVVYTLYQSQNT